VGAEAAAPPAEEETAAQETPEKIRRLVVLLPTRTHRQFQLLAPARQTTMSDLCRTWIEEAIAEQFQ